MRHLCEICGKAFRLKESLTVHMLIHNDSTFKCPNCPKLFRTKQSLKEHSNIHNNVKHACTFCDHESSSPKALRKHMSEFNFLFIYTYDFYLIIDFIKHF